MAAPVICAITGGRDRIPTLAECQYLRFYLEQRGCEELRHGDARGTDRTVAWWISARTSIKVTPWAATDYGSWEDVGGALGPIRNGKMLDGIKPDGDERGGVTHLCAFSGGRGTADCKRQAINRGCELEKIEPLTEPRIWNLHYNKRAKRLPYAPGELIVPFRHEDGSVGCGGEWTEPQIEEFGIKLRTELATESRRAETIRRSIQGYTCASWLGCWCWPNPCPLEAVVAVWRELNGKAEPLEEY